jgi:hypothetical protein
LKSPELIAASRIRVFDMHTDTSENYPLDAAISQPLLAIYWKGCIETIQEQNLALWQGITAGEKQAIRADPETLQQLRDLGYLGD